MKGEQIIAELISLLGLVVYVCVLQHIYSEVSGHPDRSWLNQARAWWMTRGSRQMEARINKVWNRSETSEEPAG